MDNNVTLFRNSIETDEEGQNIQQTNVLIPLHQWTINNKMIYKSLPPIKMAYI